MDVRSENDFELPVDPTFISVPPTLSFSQYLLFCEEMREVNREFGLNQKRNTPVDIEFVL